MEELSKSERRKLKKQQRREALEEERRHRKKGRFWKNIKIFTIIGIILVASISFFVWLGKQPGKYDDFAKCLTEKGYTMAGTDWCSTCKTQKAYFGKSFKYINYQNCDENKAWCQNNGISRYPTWIIPDGTRITGAKKPYEFSKNSNCTIE